jgi:hypothetical protein
MTDKTRSAIIAEMKFNAKYLEEKYGLQNIIILASSVDDEGTTAYNVERGNVYTNAELCRKHIKETNTIYKYGEEEDGEV